MCSFSVVQFGHGFVEIDVLDGGSKDVRRREDAELVPHLFVGQMDGVQHHQLGDGGVFQPFDGGTAEHRVRARRVNLGCARVFQRLRALADGARRIDHGRRSSGISCR